LEPGRDYPLVVILHGMGGSGDSTLQKWLPRLKDEDFIILCPSYPAGAWWSFRAEDLVLNLIRHVKRNYPVDHNRVFLAGLSNGAIGAYMIGMFYPDHFAGIVPVAGAITDRYLHFLVNLKNTPVYSIQGVYDPIFPITFSRRINQILNDLKYPLVYHEHREKGLAHGGHFMPQKEVAGLVDWLKTQRRNPHPNIIRMVREANHLDNINWAQVTRGFQMAALQLPGPEKEPMNIHDGKITTMLATHKEPNLFEIVAQNLLELEVYLNADQVDFSKKMLVTFQELKEEEGEFKPGPKRVSFHDTVEQDLEVLLSGFKRRWDPQMLYDARITINLEEKVQFASLP
jgi:predicted esterase